MSQRLAGEQLLVLQLRAKGYSVAQIAAFTHRSEGEVRAVIAGAAEALRAHDERGAIDAARGRGLIDG